MPPLPSAGPGPARDVDGRHPGPPPPGAPRRPAHYRFDRDSGEWSWSAEMSALLGAAPRDGRPCAEALVTAARPADREQCREAIERACAGGEPFALPVTLDGAAGAPRRAVLVGEPVLAASGRVAGVEGLLVEVPDGGPPVGEPGADGDDRVRALEAEVAQLRTAMLSRAVIEQAKGALMLLTGCAEQAAFDLLAHISSHTHRKLREVAATVVDSASGRARLPDDVRDLVRDACPPPPATAPGPGAATAPGPGAGPSSCPGTGRPSGPGTGPPPDR